MGQRRNAATREPGSEAFGWYPGEARSDNNRISPNTGCCLLGLQNNAVSAELRAELLLDWNSDDQPTGIRCAVSGQSGKRTDLPELCAQDRRGRNDIAGLRLPE